jgi:hypothetical protein
MGDGARVEAIRVRLKELKEIAQGEYRRVCGEKPP